MSLLLAGVDEVGRGPLAGPVITAAVILNEPISGLRDSKQMSHKKREQMVIEIKEHAICYAYGRAESHEIDALNIHQATLLAMKRAIDALSIRPDEVLVDGLYTPQLTIPCQAIVKGDSLVYQISAASILAKVARDNEMVEMDLIYPGYQFAIHKGYPTAAHRVALERLGACPIHRKSYAPVARILNAAMDETIV